MNYYIIQALKEIESADFAEAEKLCRVSLEVLGSTPEVYRTFGIVYLRQRKFNEAIACLETAYALDDTDFQTGDLLVQAYEYAGKPREAAELNKHRLRYFPSNADIAKHIVSYYQQDATFDQKIQDIRTFVEKRVKTSPGKPQRVLFGMSFTIYPPCRVHDFLLSQALKLRGAEIIPLTCGMAQEGECNVFGGIWGGMTGDPELDRAKCLSNCQTCMGEDNKLWREWAGIEPVPVSRYVTPAQRDEAKRLVAQMDLADYRNMVFDGMPVGHWASDVIRNNHMVGDDSLVPDLPGQVRHFFFNILLMIDGCRQALQDIRPDVIVSNDSYYYQWAILEELARRQNIPFYSHWQGGRRMGWCYAHNEPAMELNLSRYWPSFSKIDLRPIEERIVDDFLAARPTGGTMTLNTADPTMNSDSHAIEEIDFSKPTVLLAANVVWDLAALNREVQFNGMIDWACQTIEFFRGHPEWQLIIKPHPGELNKNLPATRQLLAEEIANRIPQLPPNVVICSPLTKLSVYDLIPHVRFGLVFTSTVGLEMACRGMAVVTGGVSVYHDMGFTFDPPTAQEYFETLQVLMKAPEMTALNEERSRLARKFLYLYLFRYYTSLNLFDHSYTDHPTLLIHDALELMPGANGVLDYVCDSILTHQPIVSKDRLPPLASTKRGLYNFTPQESLAAVRLVMDGYTRDVEEKIIEESGGLQSVRLADSIYHVPKGIFKPGELSWIYQEVVQPSDINPHAYENNSVTIHSGDVVIDTGACAGFFTRQALKRGAQRVYAFEPLQKIASALQETFRQECKAGTVIVAPIALTNTTGTASFNNGDHYICEARLTSEGAHTVMTSTLDDFVRSQNVERIDFIKMDIEGEEMNAVMGAVGAINRFKPRLAIAVYHQYENAALVRDILLNNCPGYKVEFSGRYMYETPHRPYMVYGFHDNTLEINSIEEFKGLKLVLESPPTTYVVGVTNICNLRCPLCVTGLRQQKKNPQFMEFELFQQIIEKIQLYAQQVQLYKWGESLLHPRIIDMLALCDSYNLNTEISSNLSIENCDKILEALVRFRLHHLIVSFDGVTQEDYSRYREGGDLDVVLSNIRKIKELKVRYNSEFPVISLQFLRNKFTGDQVRVIEDNYLKWGADKYYVCDMTTVFKDRDLDAARQWFSDQEIAQRKYLDIDVSMHGKPCYFLYTTMIIEQDGSIPSCCFATDPKDDFGQWDNSKSILEMYNSDRFIQARRMFREKKHCIASTCDDCCVFTTYLCEGEIVQRGSTPMVTVIIPSYNRARMLGITIESFINQDYPKDLFEIIIADNNSTDNTREVVAHWQSKSTVPITYLFEQRQGVHYARNSAAKKATGEILYFTDDDMIADSRLLAEIVTIFSMDSQVGTATGRVLPKWEVEPPEWILKLCYNGWLSIFDPYGEDVRIEEYDLGVYSCHQAIRRDAFLKSGGFNPESTFTDYVGDGETGLNIKLKDLGYKFGYNSKSIIHHMIPPSRMTQDYLNKRLANQGSADCYTEYKKNIFSQNELLQRIASYQQNILEHSYYATLKRLAGEIEWRIDEAKTHYYLNRIAYDLRLIHDPKWRELVLKFDWINE